MIPTLGPFPLANGSFPWFEGTTVSTTSSSAQGAGAHELGHAFALPHDFTNDDNFFGNLMGNGLRGVRGFFYPDQYPDSSVALSASSALHLNASAFFNTPTPSGPSPTVFVFSCGTVDGLAGCDFMASSLGGTLAGAVLRRNGSAVASMPLTGGFAATTILTHDYSPGVADNWELVVYDSQSLFSSIRQITFIPGIGPNRAPFPAIRVGKHSVVNGEQVVLDASRSFDPDGSTSQVRVEWDLNGDGTFDTPPSFAKQLSTSFAAPGTYQLTARLTDGLGDSSVSSPIGIRVEPGIVNDLVTLDVINSGFSPDATGCPSEYAGKFFINALLANRSELDLSRMRMGIINLTEGVLMMGTNAVFEERILDPPNVSNQHLASGEAASVAFTLCLEKKESFQFFVNVPRPREMKSHRVSRARPTHYLSCSTRGLGVYSAYVAGLPVYAQGPTRGTARRAVVRTLGAYLEVHPEVRPGAEVQVAKGWAATSRYTRPKVLVRVQPEEPVKLCGIPGDR